MYTIKNLRSKRNWKFKFPTYSLARSYLRSHIKRIRKIAANAKHVAISEYGFGISKLG